MACDLPVVTTRFGFLHQAFADGPGCTFADSDDGLLAAVSRRRETREQLTPGQVRAQVQPFSWDAIARTLLTQASGDRRQATDQETGLSPVDPLRAANAARAPEGHVAGHLSPASDTAESRP